MTHSDFREKASRSRQRAQQTRDESLATKLRRKAIRYERLAKLAKLGKIEVAS